MGYDAETVEFFTHQYRIVGDAQLSGQRLTDVLNDDLKSSLELTDVQVFRLLPPSVVPATRTSALLYKDNILFAIVGGTSAEAAVRGFYKRVDTSEWDVSVTMPSFELGGTLHVRGTGDLKTMLLSWAGQFIPLTRAKAVFALYPDITFSGDVIIVNRAFIEIICTDQE
jgi:hypothetical protein